MPRGAADGKRRGQRDARAIEDSAAAAAVSEADPSLGGQEEEQLTPPESAPPPPESAPPPPESAPPLPESAPPPPSLLTKTVQVNAGAAGERKVDGDEERLALALRKMPSMPQSHAEVEVDSMIYLKLPNWSNAHRGIVRRLHADGSVDIELRNGTLAERILPEFLQFKKNK